MPRIRTLPKAVEECKQKDPGSCITLNALRQWVRLGMISSRRAGKNYLVDLDEVERFLSNGGNAQ